MEQEESEKETRKHRRRSVRNLRRRSELVPFNLNSLDGETETVGNGTEAVGVSEPVLAEGGEMYGSLWVDTGEPIRKRKKRRSSMFVSLPTPLEEAVPGSLDSTDLGRDNQQREDDDEVTEVGVSQGCEVGRSSVDISEIDSQSRVVTEAKENVVGNVVEYTEGMSNNENLNQIINSGNETKKPCWTKDNLDVAVLLNEENSPNRAMLSNVVGKVEERDLKHVCNNSQNPNTSLTPLNSSGTNPFKTPPSMSPEYPPSPGQAIYQTSHDDSYLASVVPASASVIKSKPLFYVETDVPVSVGSPGSHDLSLTSNKENGTIDIARLDVTPSDGRKQSPGFLSMLGTFAGKVANFVKTSPSFLLNSSAAFLGDASIAEDTSSARVEKSLAAKDFTEQDIEQSAVYPLTDISTSQLNSCVVMKNVEKSLDLKTPGGNNFEYSSRRSMDHVEKSAKKLTTLPDNLTKSAKKKRDRSAFLDTFNAVSYELQKEMHKGGREILPDSKDGLENNVKDKSGSEQVSVSEKEDSSSKKTDVCPGRQSEDSHETFVNSNMCSDKPNYNTKESSLLCIKTYQNCVEKSSESKDRKKKERDLDQIEDGLDSKTDCDDDKKIKESGDMQCLKLTQDGQVDYDIEPQIAPDIVHGELDVQETLDKTSDTDTMQNNFNPCGSLSTVNVDDIVKKQNENQIDILDGNNEKMSEKVEPENALPEESKKDILIDDTEGMKEEYFEENAIKNTQDELTFETGCLTVLKDKAGLPSGIKSFEKLSVLKTVSKLAEKTNGHEKLKSPSVESATGCDGSTGLTNIKLKNDVDECLIKHVKQSEVVGQDPQFADELGMSTLPERNEKVTKPRKLEKVQVKQYKTSSEKASLVRSKNSIKSEKVRGRKKSMLSQDIHSKESEKTCIEKNTIGSEIVKKHRNKSVGSLTVLKEENSVPEEPSCELSEKLNEDNENNIKIKTESIKTVKRRRSTSSIEMKSLKETTVADQQFGISEASKVEEKKVRARPKKWRSVNISDLPAVIAEDSVKKFRTEKASLSHPKTCDIREVTCVSVPKELDENYCVTAESNQQVMSEKRGRGKPKQRRSVNFNDLAAVIEEDSVEKCRNDKASLSQTKTCDIGEVTCVSVPKELDEKSCVTAESNKQEISEKRGRGKPKKRRSVNINDLAAVIEEDSVEKFRTDKADVCQTKTCDSGEVTCVSVLNEIDEKSFETVMSDQTEMSESKRKQRRKSAGEATLRLQMLTSLEQSSPEAGSPSTSSKGSRKRKSSFTVEELEKLYKNKNYVKPEEHKPWQTIFENPLTEEFFGKKRLQRVAEFEKPSQMKLRRRLQKAVKNGWDPKKRRKQELSDAFVQDKLDSLFTELECDSNDSLKSKLQSIVNTE